MKVASESEFTEPPANVYAGVYRALLWGMTASTVLFAVGVLRALGRTTYVSLNAAPMPGWSTVGGGLLRLEPTSLMVIATLVLILTPVARVVISLVAFWVDGDYRFVAVTGIVLGVIGLTVLLGSLGLH